MACVRSIVLHCTILSNYAMCIDEILKIFRACACFVTMGVIVAVHYEVIQQGD